jgi:hypothetical protein
VVYGVDPAGALFPCVLRETPGIGFQVSDDAVDLGRELAPPQNGYVWALVGGSPELTADHRGMVYSTATGQEQYHDALGELPAGVTKLVWPGPFHVWSGDAWVIDEVARMDAAQAVERTWRNVQIAATDYLAMPDYPITQDQRSELYSYRQALRDWPDVTLFPDPSGRPQPPAWIEQLPQ